MPFVMTLGFATETDRDEFIEKTLPRVRGQQVDPPAAEEDGVFRLGVSVTSQTAARDLCHQIVGFLAHSKKDQVTVSWNGGDGHTQSGTITGESARDAEVLSVRVGAAAKAQVDAEKGKGGGRK